MYTYMCMCVCIYIYIYIYMYIHTDHAKRRRPPGEIRPEGCEQASCQFAKRPSRFDAFDREIIGEFNIIYVPSWINVLLDFIHEFVLLYLSVKRALMVFNSIL